MAAKRPAGFNIPLNFYDGPEVDSIPKRIRAAAIGVWALAGNYAATQLSDGNVPAGVLKSFGCTDAIRAALKVTINKKGELSPLWVDAPNGGVQLTNWPKHQRTNEEVSTYRASEAERKRLDREARKAAAEAKAAKNLRGTYDGTNAYLIKTSESGDENVRVESSLEVGSDRPSTSIDEKTSGRTSVGRPAFVRSASGQTKTETETEKEQNSPTKDISPNVGGDERGLSVAVLPSASRLVSTLIPQGIPASVRAGLRIQASQLMNGDGIDGDVVAESLRRWLAKPGSGVGLLPSLAADVIRERAMPNGGIGKSTQKALGYRQIGAELINEIHGGQQ